MPDPISRLADLQATAQGALSDRTLAQLTRLWSTVTDHGEPQQLAAFTRRAGIVLRNAEVATGQLTETYLRQVLRQLGIDVPAARLVALPESLRADVAPEQVLLRPAATVRYLRSKAEPRAAAVQAGLDRLLAIGATNLQLALRQSTVQTLSRVDGVRGYRRILRPYLSRGGSCGLCVAAADRVYGKRDLLPIHTKCKCAVMPVTRAGDPGLQLNVADLERLYGSAGGTEAARLKRTRYRVEQHGELGPVLVPAGQHFRDVEDVAAAIAS